MPPRQYYVLFDESEPHRSVEIELLVAQLTAKQRDRLEERVGEELIKILAPETLEKLSESHSQQEGNRIIKEAIGSDQVDAIILYAIDQVRKESLQQKAIHGNTQNVQTDAAKQEIIDKAQAESTHQAEVSAHLEPNARVVLASIALNANHLDEIIAALREREIPMTVTEVETVIGGLRAITQESSRTAWRLGMHAVERGLITQTQLAVMLGVNKGTVSRRYREAPGTTE
jgi:hypothetical protein